MFQVVTQTLSITHIKMGGCFF